jgi:hypothetical protein
MAMSPRPGERGGKYQILLSHPFRAETNLTGHRVDRDNMNQLKAPSSSLAI